jgi:hypothetical protein
MQLHPSAHHVCREPDLAVAVGEGVRDEVVERLRGTIRVREQNHAG